MFKEVSGLHEAIPLSKKGTGPQCRRYLGNGHQHKVKRDHKRSIHKSTAEPSLEEKVTFKRKLAMFLADEHDAAPTEGKSEPKRLANMQHIKGLNHMLFVSAGLNLKFFQASYQLKPLGATESREWLNADKCDPRLLTEGQKRRSMIRDVATGKVRLERNCEQTRHRIHIMSDRGAASWPSNYYLFGPLALIGSFRWDEAHKSWDDPQNTIGSLGMGSLLWCVVLSVNFTNGPWNSAALLGSLRSASQDYFSHMDKRCQLFGFFYPHMRAAAGESCGSWGTEESLDRVWSWFRSCPFFVRKGAKTKLTRWFSIFYRLEEFLQWWWAVAAMTAILAFQKGTFTRMNHLIEVSAQQLTSLQGKVELDLMRKNAKVGLAGKPLMRHDGNAESEAQRKARGVLHCVAATLFSSVNRLLSAMLTVFVRPLREAHGKRIVMQKTPRGCRTYSVDIACGRWLMWEMPLVAQLTSESALRAAGFSAATDDDDEVVSVAEEEMLAHYAWDFVTRLLGARVVGWLLSSWALPGRFYGLVSDSPDDVKHC